MIARLSARTNVYADTQRLAAGAGVGDHTSAPVPFPGPLDLRRSNPASFFAGYICERGLLSEAAYERHSKASVVSVARPVLPPLSGLILSCKWLIASALIDHSSCSSVVPGGLKLYS
jgi:hypothetical protein